MDDYNEKFCNEEYNYYHGCVFDRNMGGSYDISFFSCSLGYDLDHPCNENCPYRISPANYNPYLSF